MGNTQGTPRSPLITMHGLALTGLSVLICIFPGLRCAAPWALMFRPYRTFGARALVFCCAPPRALMFRPCRTFGARALGLRCAAPWALMFRPCRTFGARALGLRCAAPLGFDVPSFQDLYIPCGHTQGYASLHPWALMSRPCRTYELREKKPITHRRASSNYRRWYQILDPKRSVEVRPPMFQGLPSRVGKSLPSKRKQPMPESIGCCEN
jgi:hypothetical protein